ncbi:MAG: hypothetical protein GY710_03620 [Desulfobacteraceae bacterium]|nr:hypothetical protein [Desulfobacteraceae bacterium]
MGTAVPVDSFGPESGKVANMLFFPLHPSLFQHTKNVFVRQRILGHNPNNLALLIFTEGKETKYFSLEALDKIILPSLSYPKSQSIHMVVCRTLKMHHVVPIKRRWDTKVNPNPNPKAIWNSIPKEML